VAVSSRYSAVTKVEAALFSLLACNTVYFIVAGRVSEALESVAWYVLLTLFLLETKGVQAALSPRALAWNHALRLAATLAILASAALYVREKEWLDAINLLLWVAVVVVLELEVRRPAALAAHRRAFTTAAALLYAALAVLVIIWLARGEWMDAWDAATWLAAFGVLELDVLKSKKHV
jgi:hypothetical protein